MAFWHACILPAAYYFRARDVAIMVSSSFDGELIARVVNRLGFRAIRGSSTRGAVRALLGMHEQAAQGAYTVFTADGPKGPRFVAKPGPLLLARSTQQPIYCFHLAPRRAWQLNTWDRMLIPKPFTKVHLRWSKRNRGARRRRPRGDGNFSSSRCRQRSKPSAWKLKGERKRVKIKSSE